MNQVRRAVSQPSSSRGSLLARGTTVEAEEAVARIYVYVGRANKAGTAAWGLRSM